MNKVFFHSGAPCHGCSGIGEMWQRLDAAGAPFGVYSVEGAGLIAEAAQYARADPIIYRTLATDVAPYNLTPKDAAMHQWTLLMAHLPPEVKALKSRVWVEVGNEQDKTRADWLGKYYSELAAITLPQGYRICGPGWATGEPEPGDWQTPGMLAWLRLCAAHPEQLAVTVHEYSLDADDIMTGAPWLVGRVRFLFDACDAAGIAHPVIFVTELGWAHNDLPHADKARGDIMAAAALYAGYPAVRAAFLWTLMGGDKKTLAAELNTHMDWLTEWTIESATEEEADARHTAVVVKLPQEVTVDEWQRAAAVAYRNLHTMTASHDDTLTVLRGGNSSSYVKVAWPERPSQQATIAAVAAAGYRWEPLSLPLDGAALTFLYWPLANSRPAVTQAFGANPASYTQFGLPGHEGVDLRAALDEPVRAVADGVVSQRTTAGNYGNAVRLSHPGGWETLYAHLNRFADVKAGDAVRAGQVIGYAGTTGNSTGVHLHLGLKRIGYVFTGPGGVVWPSNLHDPTPYLAPFLPAALDMLDYVRGDGRIYGMTVLWEGAEHYQQMQTQTDGDRFYLVKNQEWEELWAGDDAIWRGADTSPGNGEYYVQRQGPTLYGAKWCPRRWQVGEVYERNPLITFHRKADGQQVRGGYHRSWLKFAARHGRWQAARGLAFDDVVELHWLLSPTASAPAERYFYALGVGLVGWQSSAGNYSYVAEVFTPGQRRAMERERVVGL